MLYNDLKTTSKLDLMSNHIEIEREKIELAGRSDLMITDESRNHRVVLEFKLLHSSKESSAQTNRAIDIALSQIKQKDYGVDSRYSLARYACVLNLIYTPHDHTFDKLQVKVRKL